MDKVLIQPTKTLVIYTCFGHKEPIPPNQPKCLWNLKIYFKHSSILTLAVVKDWPPLLGVNGVWAL